MSYSQGSKKIAAVTGATGAIGQAITASLADLGFQVYLLVRNPDKANFTTSQIQAQSKAADLRVIQVDVSSQASICGLSKSWEGPLHVLINNAATAPQTRQETPAGIEVQFATNVLGYFWMSHYFEGILRKSGPARIVNVASYWAGGLDFSDLEFNRRSYHNHDAYRQSKQANRMLSAYLASILDPLELTVNSCHPGDVNSSLSNALGFGGSQSSEQAARTPVWLAESQDMAQISGKYFENQKESFCSFSQNLRDAERLYQICLSYTDSC